MRKKRFTKYEYQQANKFIQEMYDLYGQGLEMEDSKQTSWMAFWEIRSTMLDVSNTELLWVLAKKRIVIALREMRKVRNNRIKLESNLSLNQTWDDSDEPEYTYFTPVQGDFSNAVCLWSYVQELGKRKEIILKKLYYGEEDSDIMDALQMEPEEYYEIKWQLRNDMLKYFEII